MALNYNPQLGGYGTILIKCTDPGSDSDFLGFQIYACDENHTVASEVLVDEVQDASLAGSSHTFIIKRPTGKYFFNVYSVDVNHNRSTLGSDQKIEVSVKRILKAPVFSTSDLYTGPAIDRSSIPNNYHNVKLMK